MQMIENLNKILKRSSFISRYADTENIALAKLYDQN